MTLTITPQVSTDEQLQYKQNLAIQALARAVKDMREPLSANRTYYIATTGSDTNDGKSSTTPFLTVQKAIDTVCNKIDLNGFSVTISVAAGTYTGAISLNDVVGLNPTAGSLATHKLRITGDTITPANCIISTSITCVTAVGVNTTWLIEGFQFKSSGGYAIESDFAAKVYFNACDFNQAGAGYHLVALYNGKIESLGDATISADPANGFALSSNQAMILFTPGKTITLSGTRNFPTAFLVCQKQGFIVISTVTFVGIGLATGQRAIIDTGGGVDTNGARRTSTVTFTAATDRVTWTTHGLAVNDTVFFETTGTLPTRAGGAGVILVDTFYYVKTVVDANNFTIADTPGGATIDITSAGTPTTTGLCADAGLPGNIRVSVTNPGWYV